MSRRGWQSLKFTYTFDIIEKYLNQYWYHFILLRIQYMSVLPIKGREGGKALPTVNLNKQQNVVQQPKRTTPPGCRLEFFYFKRKTRY